MFAAAGAEEKMPLPPEGLPKMFDAGAAAAVGVLAFPPKIFAADGVVCVALPPKMLAACAAGGGLVAALPKIDGAEDVCEVKAFDVPNALPENMPPPLLFAFPDTFGLQMEKSLKMEPTSEDAVVDGGVGAMVDVAVDGVPNPLKMEAAVELAAADAKPNGDVGDATATFGFASLASDLTATIVGVAAAVVTGVPNTLLANGELVLVTAPVFAVDEIPNPLKIEAASG